MTNESSKRPTSERLPNFIVMGAQKSGTTALYYALKQHPEIFLSDNKEPEYFLAYHQESPLNAHPLKARITEWQQYLKLFAFSDGKRAVGEASVMYLSGYFPEKTAIRIRQRLPHVRLIAILRHPAERAYSAYTYFRSRGVEQLPTFEAALAAEDQRISGDTLPDLCYRRNGLYGYNLSQFYQHISPDQILVCLYEDWLGNPQLVLQKIFRFLGLDESIAVFPKKHAVTSYRRSGVLSRWSTHLRMLDEYIGSSMRARLQHRITQLNRVAPPPLDPATRDTLVEFYREDILTLQRLIKRDLSHWLR